MQHWQNHDGTSPDDGSEQGPDYRLDYISDYRKKDGFQEIKKKNQIVYNIISKKIKVENYNFWNENKNPKFDSSNYMLITEMTRAT